MLEVKKSIFLIVSQYEFTMAPYPGQITIATNCGLSFHPKLNYKNNIYFISTFANERLANSICEGDEFSFLVSTSYFFDSKNNQLLSVDFYQRKGSPQQYPPEFFNHNFKEVKNISLTEFSLLIK